MNDGLTLLTLVNESFVHVYVMKHLPLMSQLRQCVGPEHGSEMNATPLGKDRLTLLTYVNVSFVHVDVNRDLPLKSQLRQCVGPEHGNDMNTTLLALDLGTQTGWALASRDGHITSGSQCFKPQRFEGGGMRFLRFKRWLTDLKHCTDGIDQVVFEEVRRHAGVDAAHAYGGFMGQLTAWCEHHQIPYQGVPVGTIKKHATGKGNASKDEVIAAVRARGHAPSDDNEADALALLYLTLDAEKEL